MSDNTPGPWLFNHNNNWKTNPFSITVRKPGVHSATVANIPTRMTIPPQEQQANARLIAAAPELLDMLTKLIGAIDRMPSNPADGLADEARELIAKATGETPCS